MESETKITATTHSSLLDLPPGRMDLRKLISHLSPGESFEMPESISTPLCHSQMMCLFCMAQPPPLLRSFSIILPPLTEAVILQFCNKSSEPLREPQLNLTKPETTEDADLAQYMRPHDDAPIIGSKFT